MNRLTTYLLCLAIVALIAPLSYAQEGGWGAPSVYMEQEPHLLFAAFYEYGLQVFDVSHPDEPENVGEVTTHRQQALDVVVDGDYAYVADGHGGMQIYDISDPEDIELATSFNRPANARAIALDSGYAYIATSDAMQIYDVNDPLNAYWITTYEEDIQYDQALEVRDGLAYVACGVEGLKIYDVSVPLDTHKIGHVIQPGMARSVALQDNYAFIGAGSAGLQIIDITYPDDPQITGKGIHVGDLADGVFVDGDICYIADRYTGLHIIDISDPFAPTELGALRVKGKASDVFVMGGYAFVAAVSGDISIVDVSNPADPALVNWLRWHGTARSIVVVS